MLSLDYIGSHLAGVWRMARASDNWRDRLDLTAEGVFRSFQVALLILPLTALRAAAARTVPATSDEIAQSYLFSLPLAGVVAVEYLQILLTWAAHLGVLAGAMRWTQRQERAVEAFVGYNWTRLFADLLVTVALVAAAPLMSGSDPQDEAAVFIAFVATGLAVFLYWGVVRRALGFAVGPTIMILVLFSAAGLLIGALVGGVLSAIAPQAAG